MNTTSNIQQIFSMVNAFFGVLFILALPVLVSLGQTGRVMERRYPKVKQQWTVGAMKQTDELLSVVPVVGQTVTSVLETQPLPYDHTGIRIERGYHVLDSFQDSLKGKVDVALAELDKREGDIVKVAGFVSDVQVFKTKRQELVANAGITDPSGRAEITLYPQVWKTTPIDQGDIVLLKGEIRKGQILVSSLEIVGEVPFGM